MHFVPSVRPLTLTDKNGFRSLIRVLAIIINAGKDVSYMISGGRNISPPASSI